MMGSRPARRNDSHDIENLRAIPWVFAWTQNRLLLPAWLGAGDGLLAALTVHKISELQEMVTHWPFFGTLFSMVEMVLVKASVSIATLYEQRLAPEKKAMGDLLREKYHLTVSQIRDVLAVDKLLNSNPVLLRTIMLRSPYLYPLHALQAELLYRVRKNNLTLQETDVLRDALMVSISGIAAGMQNTG